MADVKQAKMVSAILKGQPDYKAYQIGMNCSEDNAKKHASEYMMRHPEVKQKAIDIIAKREDLSIDKALDVVSHNMRASSVGKYGEQADHVARLEAAKVLLRLHGELKEGQTQTQTVNQINIVNEIPIDKLRQLIDEVKHMRSHMDDITDGEVVGETPQSNGG